MTFGHKIWFDSSPSLSELRWEFKTLLLDLQMGVVRKSMAKLLQKQALRRVPIEEVQRVLGYYSHVFATPKLGLDKWRVVINMKQLNKFVHKETFKMEGVFKIKSFLQLGMLGLVVDLGDAY